MGDEIPSIVFMVKALYLSTFIFHFFKPQKFFTLEQTLSSKLYSLTELNNTWEARNSRI